MPKKKFILFVIFFSFALHILVVSLCSLYIGARPSPLVCSWQNIVSKSDLFLKQKRVIFPRGVNFPQAGPGKKYFFLPFYKPRFLRAAQNKSSGFSFFAGAAPLKFLDLSKGQSRHLYLWERVSIFPSPEEEKVSYKACISRQGKVLFLYPETLPFNSSGSLRLQEYIREAALFLDNKFSWTRLEGVVK